MKRIHSNSMGVRFAKQCQNCGRWTKKRDRLTCKGCGSIKLIEQNLAVDRNHGSATSATFEGGDAAKDAEQMQRVYDIYKQLIGWEPCVNNLFAHFFKAGLPPHDCFEFIRACEFKGYLAGDHILQKGEPMFCIYFVATQSNKLPLHFGCIDGKYCRTTITATQDMKCLCLTAARYARLIALLLKFYGKSKGKSLKRFTLLLQNLRRQRPDSPPSQSPDDVTTPPSIARQHSCSYNYNILQSSYSDPHCFGATELLIGQDNLTKLFHGMQSIPHTSRASKTDLQLVVASRKLCDNPHVVRLCSVVWTEAAADKHLFHLTKPIVEPARVRQVACARMDFSPRPTFQHSFACPHVRYHASGLIAFPNSHHHL